MRHPLTPACPASRLGRRDDADTELKAAIESGDQELIAKFSKRTVKVTKIHNDECKHLLTLMGVPYVEVRPLLKQALEGPPALVVRELVGVVQKRTNWIMH